MEVLIGWDFKEGKQGFFGIFGEVLGWSDTTEEQGRKTLHSHILLFIALFDRLITMLWSTSEEVRRKAKEELTKYISRTMSSSYEIVEEDYTHEKKGKEHEDLKSLCRIIPKVVPEQTLSIVDSSRSVYCGYWNINQLSIDYACRPRLRTRLTLSGLAWLRNPWSFGGRVSHPSFATHVYILTCVTSTAGFLRRFTSYTTLSYPSTLLDLATGIVCE